jgi:hypothetical protein
VADVEDGRVGDQPQVVGRQHVAHHLGVDVIFL